MIQHGYAKCAQFIGSQFTLYRCAVPINPTAPVNNLGPILMSANVSWDYMKSNRYGTAVWNLIIDTITFPNIYLPQLEPGQGITMPNPCTVSYASPDSLYSDWIGCYETNYQIPVVAKVGDYLVPAGLPPQDNSIYFVAQEQYLLPILGVKCNATIDIIRPTYPTGNGYQGYSEYTQATSEVIAVQMPVSLLELGSAEKAPTKLPTDTNQPKVIILMPNLGGVVVRTDDIIIDEVNQNYVVNDNELTELGWRIVATQVVNSR